MVDNEYKAQVQKYLKKFYDELSDRQRELRIKQDQLVITLSVATLGFSVSFIKDVVPVSVAEYEIALFASWFVLIACVVAVIVSTTMGTLAHQKYMDKVHDAMGKWEFGIDDTEFLEDNNVGGWLGKMSYISHYLSPVLLILGLLLNVVFITLNYGMLA